MRRAKPAKIAEVVCLNVEQRREDRKKAAQRKKKRQSQREIKTAHFVTFYSPGTFTAESATLPIASWDLAKARVLVPTILERHGATPYGFRFTTRSRGAKDLDSKVTDTSPLYWLGGKIETLAEVKARRAKDGKDDILISNMEANGYERIITNTNSYRCTMPFVAGEDVLLEWPGKGTAGK